MRKIALNESTVRYMRLADRDDMESILEAMEGWLAVGAPLETTDDSTAAKIILQIIEDSEGLINE